MKITLCGMAILVQVGFVGTKSLSQNYILPNTQPLSWTGDLASRLIDSCDQFLLNQIENSIEDREHFWQRNLSSSSAYEKSVQKNREDFAKILGIRDKRNEFDNPDMLGMVGSGPGYTIHQVRWPAFNQVHGEGLLVIPDQENIEVAAIVIPDADQTPEDILGLSNSLPNELQIARFYAEKGMRVLVPALINRGTTHKQLSDREFIYRSAFPLGRHIIGYEIQKILSGVDWLKKEGTEKIILSGYGEGGLLAFYSSAVDTRIDETQVSGYFGSRQTVWEEPIYRNVFGLLHQFGDAEIASLIAPRTLRVNSNIGTPEVSISPGTGGKPGRLTSQSPHEVTAEIKRAEQLVDALNWQIKREDLEAPSKALPQIIRLPEHLQRHNQMLTELDLHNQWLLTESPYVRKAFMNKINTDSINVFQASQQYYRDYFQNEVIGKFDLELLAPNARSRKIDIASDLVTAYEIVLDVFPGLFAYGILIVPNDLKPGEKRPVVVCQHGLEGRPQSTIGEEGFHYYKAFATKLAEHGYITFAPQNIYIFEDRFRTLQFKANAIKKTLFSLMVPQHQQITNWLGTLDIVDQDRIAFYGLSYGGKSAMRIPALVGNYCISICSADFNDWVWKLASSRSPYSYVWTGEYEIFEWDLGSTFNYSEMATLIAPRPFMVERGHFDGVAPDETVAYEYAKIRNLYSAQLGIGDRTEIEWFVGPHTINGIGTFKFLDKHLKFGRK
ncbi:MAG: dienelactone hydrolase family protein [Saprospiraceae bacterium]|nr:dienelactone hydrolase family protein [Saprospiraceae bacterium]